MGRNRGLLGGERLPWYTAYSKGGCDHDGYQGNIAKPAHPKRADPGDAGGKSPCDPAGGFPLGEWSFPKLKIPHQSHADFCSTDTAGGLDNKKRRYAPRRGEAYRPFLVGGVPKGATPPFGTRLCEAKCKCVIRSVGVAVKMPLPPGRAMALKRQENRAVLVWCGAASAGLVSSADRAYMKTPVPRPTLRLVDKVSRSCGRTPGKVTGQRAAVKAEMNGVYTRP